MDRRHTRRRKQCSKPAVLRRKKWRPQCPLSTPGHTEQHSVGATWSTRRNAVNDHAVNVATVNGPGVTWSRPMIKV
eukprot:366560-Chlamydomonas_euryale.AAC.11